MDFIWRFKFIMDSIYFQDHNSKFDQFFYYDKILAFNMHFLIQYELIYLTVNWIYCLKILLALLDGIFAIIFFHSQIILSIQNRRNIYILHIQMFQIWNVCFSYIYALFWSLQHRIEKFFHCMIFQYFLKKNLIFLLHKIFLF